MPQWLAKEKLGIFIHWGVGLDDGVARNLGLALSLARLAALSLAIVISALLVNAVGIIGFIGLFAPLLAKMLGARRLLPRLMLASLIGALILWLSDQIILWLTRVWMEVSTGSVTALIGAPLLLWLLPRLRSISAPDMKVNDRVAAERQHVLAFALAGSLPARACCSASSGGALPLPSADGSPTFIPPINWKLSKIVKPYRLLFFLLLLKQYL